MLTLRYCLLLYISFTTATAYGVWTDGCQDLASYFGFSIHDRTLAASSPKAERARKKMRWLIRRWDNGGFKKRSHKSATLEKILTQAERQFFLAGMQTERVMNNDDEANLVPGLLIKPGQTDSRLARIITRLDRLLGTKVYFSPGALGLESAALFHDEENAIFVPNEILSHPEAFITLIHEAVHAYKEHLYRRGKPLGPLFSSSFHAYDPKVGISDSEFYPDSMDTEEISAFLAELNWTLNFMFKTDKSLEAASIYSYITDIIDALSDVMTQQRFINETLDKNIADHMAKSRIYVTMDDGIKHIKLWIANDKFHGTYILYSGQEAEDFLAQIPEGRLPRNLDITVPAHNVQTSNKIIAEKILRRLQSIQDAQGQLIAELLPLTQSVRDLLAAQEKTPRTNLQQARSLVLQMWQRAKQINRTTTDFPLE